MSGWDCKLVLGQPDKIGRFTGSRHFGQECGRRGFVCRVGGRGEAPLVDIFPGEIVLGGVVFVDERREQMLLPADGHLAPRTADGQDEDNDSQEEEDDPEEKWPEHALETETGHTKRLEIPGGRNIHSARQSRAPSFWEERSRRPWRRASVVARSSHSARDCPPGRVGGCG